MVNNRITVVVAAGNDNKNAAGTSPASAPGVIVVGSSDITDTREPSSNYGPLVNIFAPGVGITAASKAGRDSLVTASGTSAAAGHVAGVAAYFLSQNRQLTPGAIAIEIFTHATQNVISAVPTGTTASLVFNGGSQWHCGHN